MVNPVTILQWLGHPVSIAVLIVLTLLTIRLKRRRQQYELPSTETRIGRRVATRTALTSVILVAGLLTSYLLLTFLLPRDTVLTNSREQLPNASSGILIVDVSGSIGEKNKPAIIALFEEAIERKLNLGLVFFAGDGYLVWGPNVPAEESLAGMIRYFEVNEQGRSVEDVPWTLGGGTEIYEGLIDALRAQELFALRGFPNTPIVLISDLDDYKSSKSKVVQELERLRLQGAPVWIIQLGRNPERVSYNSSITKPFADTLGKGAFIEDLSVLEPVRAVGNTTGDGATSNTAEVVFAVLTATALLLILVDAFVLPRLPVRQRHLRKEE